MRSLEQWLAHQSQVHPQTIDLGLTRLEQVLERLQWRQPQVPVITVGGTNGKGSVSAYCASILSAAGIKVGVFTSPHLRDYRERIRLHDRLVTEGELVQAFERIELARGEISLTFFEYNALAALLIFEAARMDAWVMEVGMGGRLDAVNVVDPTVAVVVSIAADHQEFLGTSLDAIATEKAGIFRSHRVAILGSRDLPPVLLEIAESVNAYPKRLGIEFDFTRGNGGWCYRGSRWELAMLPPPALEGDAQFANAATAIAAVEALAPRLTVSRDAIEQGLRAVTLVGRFQIITPLAAGVQWILDVAHNPAAARVLKDNLRELATRGRSIAVCAILSDKDAPGIAKELHDSFDAWWLAPISGARGSTAAALARRIADQVRAPLAIAADIAAACAAAHAAAAPHGRVVVFGSFHTVGPALDWLESQGIVSRPAEDDNRRVELYGS